MRHSSTRQRVGRRASGSRYDGYQVAMKVVVAFSLGSKYDVAITPIIGLYREVVASHSPGLRSYPGTMPGQRFYPNGVASITLEVDFRQSNVTQPLRGKIFDG